MTEKQIFQIIRYGLYLVILSAIGALLFLLQGHVLPARVNIALQVGNQPAVAQARALEIQALSDRAGTTVATSRLIAKQPVVKATLSATTTMPASPSLVVAERTTKNLMAWSTGALASTTVMIKPSESNVLAVVGVNSAALMATPGGQMEQGLSMGTALLVTGQSADGQWLYVMIKDDIAGWMKTDSIIAPHLSAVPVLGDQTIVTVAPTATTEATSKTIKTSTAIASLTQTVSPIAGIETPTAKETIQSNLTPFAAQGPIAQVINTVPSLNVRAGPSTTYPVLTTASANASFIVLARNASSTWVQIQLPKTANLGWVSMSFVKLSMPVAKLPVSIQPTDLPHAVATPVPTANTPTNTALQKVAPASTVIISQPTVQGGQATGLKGKLVIQSQEGGAFYLYNLATGGMRVLTSGMDPTISPDSRQIAFARSDGIYVINVDGSNEHKIFGGRESLRSPKWSPDGHWIVFSRGDGEYKCRDTGDVGICPSETQLLGSLPSDLPPAERKKAAQQLLSQFPRVSKANWMIARISSTGADYRDLPALNSALAPDWVSSGIVYQSTGGLQKTQDQPNAQTQRVYFDYNVNDPDWQPGGGRIIFQSKQGSHWEIFAVNPDGSGLTGLTRPQTTLVKQLPSNVAPAWSPDGQAIAFLSNRNPDGEAGLWRVWVMNADGSHQHPLPLELPINYSYAMEQMVDWGR